MQEVLNSIEDIKELKLTEGCDGCNPYEDYYHKPGYIEIDQNYTTPKGKVKTKKVWVTCNKCQGKGTQLTRLGQQILDFLKENYIEEVKQNILDEVDCRYQRIHDDGHD